MVRNKNAVRSVATLNGCRLKGLAHMTKYTPRWTPLEDQTLKDLQHKNTYKEIAFILGRSEASVRTRFWTLGLSCKNPRMTKEEIEIIKEWYLAHKDSFIDEFDLSVLAAKMGRTRNLISRVAKRLGLTKRGRNNSPKRRKLQSAIQTTTIKEKGHPKGMLGKHHSEEFKVSMSKRVKGDWSKKTPMDIELMRVKRNETKIERYGTTSPMINQGNPYSRAKRGKREDLGDIFFRSSWEANYARYLNFLIRQGEIDKWEYEPQTFIFHGETRGGITYLPDFKIYNTDGSHEWHEVKGWMDAKSKSKLKKMAKFYPEEKVIVIGGDEYKAIGKWKSLIGDWE